jgi:hypothetical protein
MTLGRDGVDFLDSKTLAPKSIRYSERRVDEAIQRALAAKRVRAEKAPPLPQEPTALAQGFSVTTNWEFV